MEKAQLRKQILADFATISAADRQAWSRAIAHSVLALPELTQASGPMMLFLSMADELDTAPLVVGALAAGIEVCAPCTHKRQRQLLPTRLDSLDEVTSGAYGIREPACRETCPPQELGSVIVPAVAFDRRGWRLGRGGGYYDRFLELLAPEALTIGVIFSRHLLDAVPTEPHDRPVQLVVTERSVLRVARSGLGSAEISQHPRKPGLDR